ncbi:YhfZ family protein [Enterococcus sp. UD-01]|jgi:ribosomal protein L17|uniref:YhfZ family protein n=1 Tax=Enterococcus sp. UD-01 TaxID=3373911 RepID=UPI003836727F
MYLSQKGRTQQKLAEILLSCKIGSQIPTFSELHKQLSVGTGTIQSAMKEFEQNGIIRLQAQPRYGTILEYKDIKQLWGFLPNRHLVGLFPEPLSLEMRGLAMGIRTALNDFNIPLVIVYGYGSKVRFDRILENDAPEDFVISSLASAKDRQESSSDLEIALHFKEHSFYDNHSLMLLENKASNTSANASLRVGIDPNSYDQAELTRKIYPNANYVEVKYADIPFEVLNNSIDCAVWHRTIQQRFFSESLIHTEKITQAMSKEINLSEVCEAVLTINQQNKLVADLLSHIDINKVIRIQKEVLNNQLEAIF